MIQCLLEHGAGSDDCRARTFGSDNGGMARSRRCVEPVPRARVSPLPSKGSTRWWPRSQVAMTRGDATTAGDAAVVHHLLQHQAALLGAFRGCGQAPRAFGCCSISAPMCTHITTRGRLLGAREAQHRTPRGCLARAARHSEAADRERRHSERRGWQRADAAGARRPRLRRFVLERSIVSRIQSPSCSMPAPVCPTRSSYPPDTTPLIDTPAASRY